MIEEEDLLYEDRTEANVWSVSALKTIHSCGKQWEFRYRTDIGQEETPYLSFGSCVHKIIENIHKNNDFSDNWEREWSSLWYEASKQINWDGYRKTDFNSRGPKMIGKYVDANQDAKILEIESPFPADGESFKIGKYEIRGVIDQVRRTEAGRLLVVDLKTAKYPPDPLVLRADPQLTFYYHVVKEKYGEDPLLGIYHLESGKIFYTNRDEKDIVMVMQALEEGQFKVDNELFVRNVGNGCRLCPFQVACLGQFNEVFSETDSSELSGDID